MRHRARKRLPISNVRTTNGWTMSIGHVIWKVERSPRANKMMCMLSLQNRNVSKLAQKCYQPTQKGKEPKTKIQLTHKLCGMVCFKDV